MKKNVAYLIGYVCINLLVGCGSLQEKKASSFMQKHGYEKTDIADSNNIKDKLYAQYNKWRGVRYKFGGLNKRGIDCSGFVHVTFKSKLGIHLPRTTHLQSKLGKEIRKTELKAGDLVFFRTGPISRHVGIYLEKDKFLHASERRGVIISKLDNVYWKSNYWKSVRI